MGPTPMTSPQELRCRICSSSRLRLKPFGYRFNGRWLGAVECPACGIIFIDPQPTPQEIVEMYRKEYFEGDFRCGHAGSYFDEAALENLSSLPLLRRIQEYQKTGAFLEVGCAGGAFLSAARKSGFDVKGVEFSEDAATFAREKFNIDVVTGDLVHACLPASAFDVVFMGDVLEHLTDPLATLREVNRVMKPNGLLVLLCPTQTNTLFSRFGFAVYAALGKNATVHLPPYHLFEYRPGSMRYLVEHCRFEVVDSVSEIIPPGEIALRGTGMQKLGKKIFQYPNYLITKLTHVLGDRIELYARKKNGIPS